MEGGWGGLLTVGQALGVDGESCGLAGILGEVSQVGEKALPSGVAGEGRFYLGRGKRPVYCQA